MKMEFTSLVIVGVGGHALSAWDLALQIGMSVDVFINPPGYTGKVARKISDSNIPIIDYEDCQDSLSSPLFLGVGDNFLRSSLLIKLRNLGAEKFPNLISPSASISHHSSIGHGNFIGNNVSIGPDVDIQNFSILNTKVSIDHENHISDFVSLSPGTTTGGNVGIGRMTFIGMNSTIRQGLTLGENCLVGAQTYVNRSAPDNAVLWGNPARIQYFRKYGESFKV